MFGWTLFRAGRSELRTNRFRNRLVHRMASAILAPGNARHKKAAPSYSGGGGKESNLPAHKTSVKSGTTLPRSHKNRAGELALWWHSPEQFACAFQLQRKTFHRPFKRVRAGGMLLKLRNRPERRLQAVPLQGLRERHSLQARREHDACAAKGMPPSLQRGVLDRAPRGWLCPARVLRHGAFLKCVGAASLTRLRVPLRDASNSSARKCQARRPAESRDMTGSAGYSEVSSYGLLTSGSREEGLFPLLLRWPRQRRVPSARFARWGSKRSGEPTATLNV